MKLELRPSDHPDYVKVHCWLRRKYGKANKCESSNCNGHSNSYHWALKKGYEYSKDRECFIQLCQSCHKKYDMTDFTRSKMSYSKQGSKHPRSKLSESDVINIRNIYKGRGDCVMLASVFDVSISTIDLIIKRKTWKHI